MIGITPKGKTYVATEDGEGVASQELLGPVRTPNGTLLQVKRAWINLAASQTATELVPAAAHAVIRIVALECVTGATPTIITFNSAGVACGPDIYCNNGEVLPFNPHGWRQGLAINEAITLTSGAGSTTGILVQFIEIPEDEFDLL